MTLSKSFCLSEPVYLIYKMGLIAFTYLTAAVGLRQARKWEGTWYAPRHWMGTVVNVTPSWIPGFPRVRNIEGGGERSHFHQLGAVPGSLLCFVPPMAA